MSPRLKLYQDIARVMGWKHDILTTSISGRVDGFLVKISELFNHKNLSTEFELTYNSRVGDDWTIAKETFFTKMQSSMGHKDIQIGDEAFDRECLIGGDAEFLRSLLNAELRQQIFFLHEISQEFRIDYLSIYVGVKQEYMDTKEKIESLIYKIVHTGRLITQKKSMCQSCLDNVLWDPQSQVRLFNLAILHTRFSERKETADAIEKALSDESPEVQVFAGILKGEAGLSFLHDLASMHTLSQENIRDIVTQFILYDYKVSVPLLLRCYEEYESGDIRIKILEALRKFQDPSVEGFLLTQLEAEKYTDRMEALVDTLGYCGTLDSIEKLYKLEKLYIITALKNACHKSIAQIQERYGSGKDKGWLSVSESLGTKGGLSIPDGEEGGLTMEGEE